MKTAINWQMLFSFPRNPIRSCGYGASGWTRLLPAVIIASAVYLLPGLKGQAADLTNCTSYTNFSTANGLVLRGSATVTNGMLRLTPAQHSQLGSAWLPAKQPCAGGFTTSFQFRISELGNIFGNEPGGDGIFFLVQNLNATNLSWPFDDPTNSVGIFFNTFWNWPGCTNCPDVSGNSVGVLVNQNYLVQADLNPFGVNLSDGAVHQAQILFDGTRLSVMVDGLTVLTNVSLPGFRPGTDASGLGWVGFTGGTGAAFENHDIFNWTFCSGTSTTNPPPSSCAPAPTGLVSWWRAESNALDSADGNHGTLAGNVTYGPGRVGQAFVLDGNRSGVQVGTATNLQLQNFTIEAWIKRSSATQASFNGNGNGELFVVGTNPGGFGLRIDQASNQLVLGKSGGAQVSSSATVTDTNWHHVAVTKQLTNVSFYVDGVAYPAPSYDPGPFTFNAPAYIGAWFNPFGQVDNSFYGAIDELAVYSRGLTAAEIQSIFNAANIGKCVVTNLPGGCYDAGAAFSTNQNPNGLWSYGFTRTLGGAFSLNLERGNDLALAYWRSNIWLGAPAVFINPTATIQTNSSGTIVLNPGQLGFHPGPNGELGVIRFLVPTSGVYRVSAQFAGADTRGTTTDVHFLTNGVPLFNGLVSGFGPASGTSLVTNLALKAGDLLDCAVGKGANDFSFDATAIAANFCLVTNLPPPPVSNTCVSVPGMISWWRAESNAFDAIDGNHGTLVGDASYGAGRVGSGFTLDGNRDAILVGSATNLQLQNFTIETWIRRASPSVLSFTGNGNGTIFANGGSGGGLNFYVQANNVIALGKSDVNVVTSAATLVGTNWHHIAVTKQNTNVVFYVDGVAFAAPAYDSGTYSFSAPALIGAWSRFGVTENGFYGVIDEMAIYGRALSASEIQAVFAAGDLGKCFTPAPPVILSHPASRTVIVGDPVNFAVTATGTPPLSYQWRRNNTNLPSATNNTLSFPAAELAQAGSYSVLVTNLAGSAISSNALLVVNPPPPCTPARLGLVSWWRAESNALDSADGNLGTLAGNATYGPGRVGTAFVFDGDRDGVLIGTATNLQLQNFSIEGWIKRSSSTRASFNGNGNGTLFAIGGGGGGYGLWIQQSDNRLAIGKSQVNQVTSAAVVADTNWHHVAVTKAGTNVVFYVDGVGSAAPAYESGGFSFSVPGYVGAWFNPFGQVDNSFYGAIDELAVYNRGLTAAEIQSIFNAERTGKCQSPPVIVTQPFSQKVTVGSNVTFSAVAEGTPQLQYQWQRYGTNIFAADSPALSFVVAPDSGGPYSVLVKNGFGRAVSTNAQLIVNFVPVANGQSVSLLEDTATNLTLTGSDANDDALTFTILTPPAHGVLGGSGANRTYTPTADYFGPDSFTFKVNDGLVDSGMATVTLNIINVNDAPVAQSQSVATDEDTSLPITLGAFDADSDLLSYFIGTPSHGTLSGTPPSLTYHPATNYYGPDSFTFRVSDGQTNSNTATISITVRPVNDAPVAVIEVTPLTPLFDLTNHVAIAAVCGNATLILDGSKSSDVEHDPLTFAWHDGTNALGTATVLTNEFAAGTHEFTLVVSDGELEGTATKIVEVITPAQSVGLIIAALEASGLSNQRLQPLQATLQAAAASFDRCNVKSGVNQLRAFQRQVAAQVAPSDARLAEALTQAAQQVIDAVSDSAAPHSAAPPSVPQR